MEKHQRTRFKREMLDLVSQALTESFDRSVQVASRSTIITKDCPDGLLEINWDGEPVLVAVEVIRTAYPRDVHGVIWHLDELELCPERAKPGTLIKLVAAEHLSPGAKSTLKAKGYAFFERSGSLFLRTEKLLINVERPSKSPSRPHSVDLFTEAREGAVHALLQNAFQWMAGADLAEQSQTSTYTCSVVLQELERREWCETQGAGRAKRRRLIQPGLLLDDWAAHWQQRGVSRSRGYVFDQHPRTLIDRLAELVREAGVDFPWAFTGAAAANLYAPLLTSVDSAEIIVPLGYAATLGTALNMKPASKGGNVTIIERGGSSLQFREFHSFYSAYFASPYIQYLDLLDGRGRNKELAGYLREKLAKKWAAV
ncbi:type IV toxin-antitoxin system AbiEi family antitoxin [Pseudomonas aeruginosa]|uniref:type IV toxin-antitoxin system AbiEi family antitoxin n=1 Tax=Pseudomonas aeruginosa TaxID=287 RepID=UPI000A8A163C|nr:type IV toxin-antitoxin system AbiEi family antitoxin [Pseudomonas aeruginosa]MDP5764874.1 type IV toxin-antitoxin system AbiEi family antitoxin [Pseudomonas aeruginosa]